MSNIVPFPGVADFEAPRDAQPQKDVIDTLANALERAKKGELQAVALAFVEPGDFTNYEWSMSPASRSTHTLVVAASDLVHEMLQDRLRVRIALHGKNDDDEPPEAA